MGEDYWGSAATKKMVVASVLPLLFLLQSSCSTQHVAPYQPPKAPEDAYQALLKNIKPAAAKPDVATSNRPQTFEIPTGATLAQQDLNLDFAAAQRKNLASKISISPDFVIAADQLSALKINPLTRSESFLAFAQQDAAKAFWGEFEPMKVTPPAAKTEPKSKTAEKKAPPVEVKPKRLADHVDPSLKTLMKKQKAHVENDAPKCLKKATTLPKQIDAFKKVEAIWGLPAIFFITTSYIESSWGTSTDNLLQYTRGPFEDQLGSAGPDMIKTMTNEDATPKKIDGGKPIVSQVVLNDLRYTVNLMKMCNGKPTKLSHVKAANQVKKNPIITAGLTAEYLQQTLDEVLSNLSPDNEDMAALMRNGVASSMHNAGAPGILDMSRKLNARVNAKYIDGKKRAIFGIDLKTDTNRSALMKMIAKYTATEEAIAELLAQNNLLPDATASLMQPTTPVVVSQAALANYATVLVR